MYGFELGDKVCLVNNLDLVLVVNNFFPFDEVEVLWTDKEDKPQKLTVTSKALCTAPDKKKSSPAA
jgi:hypothetical protein